MIYPFQFNPVMTGCEPSDQIFLNGPMATKYKTQVPNEEYDIENEEIGKDEHEDFQYDEEENCSYSDEGDETEYSPTSICGPRCVFICIELLQL